MINKRWYKKKEYINNKNNKIKYFNTLNYIKFKQYKI